MRKNHKVFISFFALIFLAVSGYGCMDGFIKKGFPKHEGKIAGLPVTESVEILRDAYGVPHIYAQNEKDLFVALGYVHAQDRLWQMETYRRLVKGTLSEAAGVDAAGIDYFCRLLGFQNMKEQLAKSMTETEKEIAGAYASGVNAYIEKRGDDLPLEFQTLEIKPDPWEEADVLNAVVLNSWFLETNFRQEIFALAARKNLGTRELADALPSYPKAKLPADESFEGLRKLEIGPLLPEIESFFIPSAPYRGTGSNNWVVANSVDGKPLLANDPHLALMVPGIWYFAHLHAPGYEAVGATMAGSPGIVIGHNTKVAWAMTNVMTDISDIHVFRLDPDNRDNYIINGRSVPLVKQDLNFKLPKGKTIIRELYLTEKGPVVSKVGPEYNAIAALKWYGSCAMEDIGDHTLTGMIKLNRAQTVTEAFEGAKNIKLLGQNLVFGDVDGNIGRHATGAVPIRKGYSGRLPVDGSKIDADWIGFLPYEKLPTQYNPDQGWITTANARCVDDQADHPITYGWCAPYRFVRLSRVLEKMERPTPKDFQALQSDVYSIQADRIIKKLSKYKFKDQRAKQAMAILKAWDRKVSDTSHAALIFEVFLTTWAHKLLGDETGEAIRFYYHLFPAAYLAHDVLLDRKKSSLWDDIRTPEKEKSKDILENSLNETMDWLDFRLRLNSKYWAWGTMHRYNFAYPGAKTKLEHKLLSRGPIGAAGDNNTVNVAGFDPGLGGYEVAIIPSLRMIAPLGDLNAATFVGPMGQSGQPAHENYDDMIMPWIENQGINIPYKRQSVEKVAPKRLWLHP